MYLHILWIECGGKPKVSCRSKSLGLQMARGGWGLVYGGTSLA